MLYAIGPAKTMIAALTIRLRGFAAAVKNPVGVHRVDLLVALADAASEGYAPPPDLTGDAAYYVRVVMM